MAAIYQADVWCDACADDIRERLQSQGHAPADPDDERSYDSNEYPKHASDDEEFDSPQHCAAGKDCINAITFRQTPGLSVGCALGRLTSDGVEYVRRVAFEGGIIAPFWVRYFTERGYNLQLVRCKHCGNYTDTA